jgi:hypothetical protein
VTQYNIAECICCELKQRLPDRIGETERDRICSTCRTHPGPRLALKRAQDHEALLRDRIGAADGYARRAEVQVNKFRERTASALESRDRAVQVLRDLSVLHTLRPGDGCTCGRTGQCETANRLNARWVQDRINRLRDDFDDNPIRSKVGLRR